jgi:putative transposase
MARPLRLQIPGGVYHLTARGVARQAIFRDPRDRLAFLALLGRVVELHDWTCHAYCLMTTHYHLLVRTPSGDLARGMQRLNGDYAQGFSVRHREPGHLFHRRYHSVLVERDAHLLELCRYFALNPVRAGLVEDPARWVWGSYQAALGLAPRPPFLAVEWLLSCFGSDRDRAIERLRRFVEDGPDAHASAAS